MLLRDIYKTDESFLHPKTRQLGPDFMSRAGPAGDSFETQHTLTLRLSNYRGSLVSPDFAIAMPGCRLKGPVFFHVMGFNRTAAMLSLETEKALFYHT